MAYDIGSKDIPVGEGRGLAPSLTPLAVLALVVLFSVGAAPQGEQSTSLDEAWAQLGSAEPLFSQGLKAFREGRTEAATAGFEKCVQLMPRHAYARYYLANLAYIQGDFESALASMERAIGDLDLMRQLADHAGRLKLRKIGSYEQMLETEWDNTTSCRTARRLEALHDQLTDEQSKLDLSAQKERAARIKQKAHYLYFLGNILFQLKRFPDATQRYREAIELNPQHADAYNNAAAISYMEGEAGAAKDLLRRAEEQGLEDNVNLKLKALVHEALGQPTAGILEEDLTGPGPGGLGVMRFALAFKEGRSQLPPLYVNAYVVFSLGSKQAVVIDPGVEDPRLDEFVKARGLEVKAILVTHGHGDHAGANGAYAKLFDAPVWASRADAGRLAKAPGRCLEDGETVAFDGFAVRVMTTPGHTPGSLCFVVGDRLFSGDSLFKNGIGRIGEADPAKAGKIQEGFVRTIKQKLLTLPGTTLVCPGHGKTTTIAAEAAGNPFLAK